MFYRYFNSFEVDLLCFLEGSSFSDFFALQTGLKTGGISGGNPILSQLGVACKSCAICALHALQETVAADLQRAASGPMIAEKQPTSTDDCSVDVDGTPNQHPWCPCKGAGGL